MNTKEIQETQKTVPVQPQQNEEAEIDLLDLLRRVIAIRRTLYKAIGIGVVLGIIVGLSIPKKYAVSVTLSPEMGDNKSNSLSSMAASFLGGGAAMSDGVDALNASLSSDIVASTPFLMELLRMDVPAMKGDSIVAFGNYLEEESSPWWSYLLGVPGKVIGGIKSLFTGEEEAESQQDESRIITLTKKESEKIRGLKESITATVDKKTAITGVTVTLQNPKVAAVVADSVVHKLQEHIINYRTSKAKEDCAYLEKLFEERRQEYYAAQKKYADYVDTHDDLILQSVRAEQERLQNDMSLAYQVYSQVANQLQVARAKVQEEKPVFAVVEPAVVPLLPSGTGTTMYIIGFVFLSVAGVIVWELFGKSVWKSVKS